MAKAKAPKAPPFKKFMCGKKKVFLLPPAAFKVWMYHFSREGTHNVSWPKLETICKELDMAEKTVKRQRRALKLYGWLKQVGEKKSKRSQDSSGKFNVPIMTVDEGTIPEGNFYPAVEERASGVKATLWKRGKKYPMAAGSLLPTEVDSEKQVYSEKQVDGFAQPFSQTQTPSPAAEPLLKMQVPQGKNDPMVNPEGNFDPMAEKRARLAFLKKKGTTQTELKELHALKLELEGVPA